MTNAQAPDWEGFTRSVMDDWPDVGELDGFELQVKAVKFHVLLPEVRTERCGDNCGCEDYDPGDEWICYRLNFARVKRHD